MIYGGNFSFRAQLSRKEEIALNTKARGNGKSRSNAPNSSIISAGEVFADGAIVELMSSFSRFNKPDLLLWNGRKATVGPHVEHGGCTYEAPELDPILCRAMRLPAGCHDHRSARRLFDGIRNLFQRHLGLPESESVLIACFAISTWLADRLPSAPGLIISGPDEELGIDVLRLLSCVCRHPLLLAELTPAAFRSLPMELALTLLLLQQDLKTNMQILLRSSRYHGLHLAGKRGSVIDRYGATAIFCGNDAAVNHLGGGAIHVSLPPSQSQSCALDEDALNEIASHFQPRLLMYRLKSSGKVRESQVNVSELTIATSRLARTLAACFPEDSELAHDTVRLLGPQDEDARLQRANSIECVIVEVLLAFIHEQKLTEMKVGDVADLANGLLRSRGEILAYGAEEVGWKLKGLNLVRHRTSSGSQIQFDRQTSQQVHRWARAYGLGLLRLETCSECATV
jgi:hypothetical protein